MGILHIGFDVDGCLVDFNKSYVDRIISVTSENKFPPWPFEIREWDYDKAHGYSNEQLSMVWKSITADETFWQNLEPYPGVTDFGDVVTRLQEDDGHDIYFITSRPGVFAKWQTEAWLVVNMKQVNPTVLISSEKGLCARALKLDYYIDDRTENCIDVNMNSKAKCYMLKQPWNVPITHIPRIDSIMDFVEVIKNAR